MLATIIFLLLVVMNSTSFITGIICQICLIFLFFETVFGICLGCKFYPMFHKEKTQYCPGEICDVKAKQEIQKTSLLQIGVVIGFFALCHNEQQSCSTIDLVQNRLTCGLS